MAFEPACFRYRLNTLPVSFLQLSAFFSFLFFFYFIVCFDARKQQLSIKWVYGAEEDEAYRLHAAHLIVHLDAVYDK